MSAPLPANWSEAKDPKGRTFYSNHATQETTWERPVATRSAATPDAPPPYGSSSAAGRFPQVQAEPMGASGPCCTPRLTFWIITALGWVVWAFAVAAAAADEWLEGFDIVAGDERILNADCEEGNDLCDKFKAFTAMQFIAVLLCSFAMVALLVMLVRPAKDGCFSVKTLALVAACLMAAFAFFQMLAFVLMIVIEKDLDDGDEFDYKLGGTFAVAVVGTLLGALHAAAIFVFARSSGDGPFYACCKDCMAMNQESNAAVNGGGERNQQQQVQQGVNMGPPPAFPAYPQMASAAV